MGSLRAAKRFDQRPIGAVKAPMDREQRRII
jgi:hypothetical protein